MYRNFGIVVIRDIYYEPIRYAQNEQVVSIGLRDEAEGTDQARVLANPLVF